MRTNPGAELFLSRFAEGEWLGVVRPWLEGCAGSLGRSLVVAPTRGHTHALKRRCVAEKLALLGVEFLTPGLARRKRGARADPGRSLHTLVLRARIEAHLARLGESDPARLLWRSLASDLEVALGDLNDLLRAGFRPADFPHPELRLVFAELAEWLEAHGYALDPLEDESAGLRPPPPGTAPIADRILILTGGPEGRGEFFGLAALARRCPSLTVGLAMPETRGAAAGEAWVDMWEKLLGVSHQVVDIPEPALSCAAVAELWSGEGFSHENAEIIVGRTRSDEMECVAERISGLLREGAENIAVVFPKADAAHAHLVRLLDARGVVFADLIGSAGTPPEDTQIQLCLADLYERGCRMEELLALWPLLCALNLARIPPARARAVCQRLFDELPSHGIDAHVDRLENEGDGDRLEIARVARLVLPAWPGQLTLSDALARFEAVRDRLGASAPAGWQELREFARRAQEPIPAKAILEAIRAFLPQKGPVAGTAPRNGFAHVTLTTVRRAAGVAWSHAILAESNAGSWPSRRESSCWLDDEARRGLNARGRFSLGLATTDDRANLERGMWSAVARDTSRRVIFSASLHDEEDPERALEPNPWLERVMGIMGYLSADSCGRESFGALAGGRAGRPDVPGTPPAQGPWLSIWNRRRDPAAPFDEFFFADPGGDRPARISAGQIERGVRDPVRLWFDEVLRVRRVDWGTFRRERGRMMGTAVHRVLAAALRGPPHEGAFSATPGKPEAQARMAAELASLRARWPRDRYWESLLLDVGGAAQELLDLVFTLPSAPYAAAELRLPESATVDAGSAGALSVSGRPDLVLSDRPSLEGARVAIVDFKTGGDAKLSAKTMASTGASLQLGVYLEAARSLGATGSVLMLKPGKPPSAIGMDALADAVAKLGVLGRHLSTGIYGALTPDRDEYTVVFEWPLACAPIGHAILREKFERTFGAAAAAESEEADDE